MFANIGEFFVSSSLLESLAVDELPPAKWTDGLTVELLVAKLPVECFGDEKPPAKWNAGWTAESLVTEPTSEPLAAELPAEGLVECVRDELPGERVVAEGRLGMRLSMPRARAVEEYSNSSKVKWGVNCIRKRI